MQVSLVAKGGDTANLSSMYEVRLFQVLPILRELDWSRAEAMLRDNAAARANLQRFQTGLLLPTLFSVHSGDSRSGEMQMNQQVQAQLRQGAEQVVEEAEKNPQQALSDALALPLSEGRPPASSASV